MPADALANFRSQGISRLGIGPTKLEYAISNIRRVKITATSPRGQWIITLYCSIPTIFENLTLGSEQTVGNFGYIWIHFLGQKFEYWIKLLVIYLI